MLKRVAVEIGMGTDIRGADYTKAAVRALRDALWHNSLNVADELGKPLCPCNFYQDKQAEAKLRRWICACDEMQIYKYCHCLLFVNEEGMPITEYLPEDHEGRQVYGLIPDPTPAKGRALKHKAAHQPTSSSLEHGRK